ncbi:MAG: type II toxin-antitoxin system HicB family antitoxin [bacterium]|nr:type II toxin-antitoxin system HicB family antitoxin [bacterium]
MKKSRTHAHYQIVLRPEREGGYTVLVPSLPGCITHGRTVEEAHRMARDAISAYIASMKKHREPVPPSDRGNIIATIEV